MAWIVIVGIKVCPDFAYVTYVAEMLQTSLPDFKYRMVPMDYNDWANWITEKNVEHNWNHSKSPVVYRELTMRGGKEYYIGGIDQFWEYVHDYYGLEFILPKRKILELQRDNVQFFDREKKATDMEENTAYKDLYRVCVCEAEVECLSLLLPELIRLRDLHGRDGICIFLYTGGGIEAYKDLLDLEEEPDLYDESDTYHIYVQAVYELEECLSGIDLMIIFGAIMTYNPKTEFDEYLYANREIMSEYAEVINNYGKRNLRIIVAYPPTCYNATVLTELLTTVRLRNIIALTADLGLEALNIVSKNIDVPKTHLSSPPIYGFVDLNRLIDIGNIVERVEYFRPSKRTGNDKIKNTSLNTGEIHTELRPIIYLTHNLDQIWKQVHSKKVKTERVLERFGYYSKVRATMDLLKHWYSKKPTNAIISAGILTYGRYGIKNVPIVFSQPVTLVNNSWVPYENFPPPQYDIPIKDLVPFAAETLRKLQKDDEASEHSIKIYRQEASHMKLGSESYFYLS